MAMVSDEMAKRARRLLAAALGVAVAATALAAYAAVSAHHRKPALRLTARPGRQTIHPGGVARYVITIDGRHLARRLRLRVRGVPRYATAKMRFDHHSRRRATLAVFTSLRTPIRRFGLRVGATHDRLHSALRLTLVVDTPHRAALTIAGHAIAPLWPGVPEPIDVALANPNRRPVQVTGLQVALTGLSAPRATAPRPCSLGDFSVRQFGGSYPIVVPARTTRSLGAAGIPQALWPQVEIVNRSVNQDGCQGAMIALSYTAAGSTR